MHHGWDDRYRLFKFLNIVVDFLCIVHFTSFRSRFCLFCLNSTRIRSHFNVKTCSEQVDRAFQIGSCDLSPPWKAILILKCESMRGDQKIVRLILRLTRVPQESNNIEMIGNEHHYCYNIMPGSDRALDRKYLLYHCRTSPSSRTTHTFSTAQTELWEFLDWSVPSIMMVWSKFVERT